MKNSKIEWCHHTVNFWWGCAFALLADGSLSEECRNCYAHLLAKLFSRGKATWGPNGNRWIRHEAARRELYKIDKSAYARGVRERVFINSMSDTFEDRPDLEQSRCMLWGACAFVTNVDIILLTKRPQNVMRMVPPSWHTNWPAHVWIGTTCGTQQAANERIPHLLSIPAKVRFISGEPLLGPVDFSPWIVRGRDLAAGLEAFKMPGIDWVICGGESGQHARPMHPDWARSLRDQCQAAGVPFMFKQWGEWVGGKLDARKGKAMLDDGVIFWTNPGHPKIHCWPAGDANQWELPISARVGKKAHRLTLAGEELASNNRLLDGVEHNEFPEANQ